MTLAEKNADFLDSKRDLIQGSGPITFEPHKKPTHSSDQTNGKIDRQAAYKLKQAAYRKEQYQKKKEHQRTKKQSQKRSLNTPEFPPDVELALNYFDRNGFPLKEDLNSETIAAAKKKLARIFHPDVGGSHSEILELNKFADLLTKFSKR